MRRYLRKVAGVAIAIWVATVMALAGPLPPCITATLSANGTVLVTNELAYDGRDEMHGRRIVRSTFRVFPQYLEPNGRLRMKGPDRYWADAAWSVVLAGTDQVPLIACAHALVTDDAEYLVLIGDTAERALCIYRRRDHPGRQRDGVGPDQGVLVRQLSLAVLLPPEHLPAMMDDHTPPWFAAGRFVFASGGRMLLYRSRGRTVRIRLADGRIE